MASLSAGAAVPVKCSACSVSMGSATPLAVFSISRCSTSSVRSCAVCLVDLLLTVAIVDGFYMCVCQLNLPLDTSGLVYTKICIKFTKNCLQIIFVLTRYFFLCQYPIFFISWNGCCPGERIIYCNTLLAHTLQQLRDFLFSISTIQSVCI